MLAHFYEMLTTTFSHELQTPLHQQVTLVDTVIKMLPLTNVAVRLLFIIKNSSRTLQYFVNDIIDLIKIKQGTFCQINDIFTIKETIEEIANHFVLGCTEKKLQFTSTITSRVTQLLKGDQQRLKQILHNVLQNALKFTLKGEISIKIDYDRETSQLVCQVRDSGIGISREKQSNVFHLFKAYY